MTHYEVLGVAANATHDQIHSAYIRAAKQNHPDMDQQVDGQKMTLVNEAFAVLSDPLTRMEYDETLKPKPRGEFNSPTGARVKKPANTPFVPYNEHDEDDDDDWRYIDDVGDPRTATKRTVAMMPAALFFAGILLVGLSALLRTTFFITIGVVCFALAGVSLVALPILSMGAAKRFENNDWKTQDDRGRY